MISAGLLALIPNWILISLGVVLIGMEVFLGVFVLLWFGLGFVIVGMLGFFTDFVYGEYQLIFAFAIGIALLAAFRRRVMERFPAAEQVLSTYQAGEYGKVSMHEGQWMIFYKGTHWVIANPQPGLVEGENALVAKIESNRVWLQTTDAAN